MYEIQKDQSVPVKFFAGEYPVVTAVKAVATGKSVKQYEPVKLTDSGIEPVVKVAASEAVSGTSTPAKSEYENTTAGIYGIAATAAQAAEEVVVYLTGEFFADAITLPEGVTADTLAKAFRNISEFMGPSTAQMAGNSIVLADVEEKAQEVINKRVEHEITRILNGYGG